MKKELEKVCKKYSNEGGCSKCPYSEKHKNSFGDTYYSCKGK